MKCLECGRDRAETTMLLHGGGLSRRHCREEAEMLQRDCHVDLPIPDGHAGSDRPFTTIENHAAGIIPYIDQSLQGYRNSG